MVEQACGGGAGAWEEARLVVVADAGSEAGQGPLYSRRKAVGRVKRGGGGLVPSGEWRGAP